MKETIIHTHTVQYDEVASSQGAHYLSTHLDGEEAKVFFNEAKSKGHIKFEDSTGRQYTMSYVNGVYIIEYHKSSYGF